MAYTLAQLTQAVQDYTQNSETSFVNNIPNFIRNAEDIILYSVDLDDFRKNQTGTMTSGNKYLAKPTDYMSAFSMSITKDGSKEFLLIKDVNFVQEFDPSAATGTPKYYAPFDSGYFLVAPTPNANYDVELHYYYRPASLTEAGDSGTTWISTNAPTCLLYGTLVEAYTYMKGDPDMLGLYQQQFVNYLGRLKDFGEARENTDAYRMGLPLKART